MKKTVLLMALYAFYLSGCGNNSHEQASPKQIDINFKSNGMSESDKAHASSAIQAFFNSCKNMGGLAADIQAAEVSWSMSGPDKHGWVHPLEIMVKFSDNPIDKRLVTWRAFGNNCFYTVGGGLEPGIATTKSGCAKVCEINEDNAGIMFTPDESFQFLDEKTPEYMTALKKAKSDYEAHLNKKIAEAKKGDINDISDVGYLYRVGALGLEGDQYQACVWGIVKYLKLSPQINPELTPNPNDRRKLASVMIDGERSFVQRTCEKHLNETEISQAMDEASELAQTIKGKTFLERSLDSPD